MHFGINWTNRLSVFKTVVFRTPVLFGRTIFKESIRLGGGIVKQFENTSAHFVEFSVKCFMALTVTSTHVGICLQKLNVRIPQKQSFYFWFKVVLISRRFFQLLNPIFDCTHTTKMCIISFLNCSMRNFEFSLRFAHLIS